MISLNQTVLLKAKIRKIDGEDEKEEFGSHFGRKLDNRKVRGLNKSEFFQLVETLEQAYEASETVFEMGVDLSYFERYYLDIIDTILSKILSNKSIDCIHKYLYGIPYYLDIQTHKENPDIIPEVETISELWNIVCKFETNKGDK